MVFTLCTTRASFTLGWVFIALTPTRNTPSLHVILNGAEVQWNDITTPGSQSEASRPAGLPPSRWDQSIQPKSLRVKTHEWWHLMYTCHCMWMVRSIRREEYCRETARPWKRRRNRKEKWREERSIYRMPRILLNLYSYCLIHVIFLCKMWC